jgi:hypothetical protein
MRRPTRGLGLGREGCHKRAFFFGTIQPGWPLPKKHASYVANLYWAVYHEVNGFPPGKRELAHEWLRQREMASDRRERWMIFAFIAVSIAAIIVAYFAAVQLKWL